MNRKQFIGLLAAVALVGTAGWIVYQRGNNSWENTGQTIGGKLLPHLPVNSVAQIIIQSGTNELTLARRDNLWRVRERGDYPANFSQISDLLIKFADLKIVQSDEISPSQLGRFDLLPPGPATNSGTLVQFRDQTGTVLASVLLGKTHMKLPSGDSQFEEDWPDGRYVMADHNAKTVALVSDTLDNVQPRPADWLDKDFLHIEKPCAVAVQFANATNDWKLIRTSETNDWQLADARPGAKLDSSKLDGVTSPFNSPNFNDVSPGAATLTNATVLNVKTFDGFSYAAKIGSERDGSYPMTISVSADLPVAPPTGKNDKPEEQSKLSAEFEGRHKTLADKLVREKQFQNWTYQMPAYTVEPILKTRSQLMVETKNTGTNAPASAVK